MPILYTNSLLYPAFSLLSMMAPRASLQQQRARMHYRELEIRRLARRNLLQMEEAPPRAGATVGHSLEAYQLSSCRAAPPHASAQVHEESSAGGQRCTGQR